MYVPVADCLSNSLLWCSWCLVFSVSEDWLQSELTQSSYANGCLLIGHHTAKDNQRNTMYHVWESTWFISDFNVYILGTLLALHSAVSPGISSLIRFGLMLVSYLKGHLIPQDPKHENYLNDSLCLLGHFFKENEPLCNTFIGINLYVCLV